MPSSLLSAFVGTAVFSSLKANGATSEWALPAWSNGPSWSTLATVTVAFCSLAAAGLTALQTTLRYSERAEQHRKAAGRYGAIRRQMEELLATYSDEHPCDASHVAAIGTAWSEVEAAGPSVPQRLYRRLENEVRADELAHAMH